MKAIDMRLRAFEVGVKGTNWDQTVHALTAGKAKYRYLCDIRESWENVGFKDLTCRVIGPPRDSEQFRRTAENRRVGFAHVGMVVESDGRRGVIVDRDDSANFQVLFDGGYIGHCHPRWKMRYFDAAGELIFDSEAPR